MSGETNDCHSLVQTPVLSNWLVFGVIVHARTHMHLFLRDSLCSGNFKVNELLISTLG